jgi:competence ComEA-like helix-hairpin-helix protein
MTQSSDAVESPFNRRTVQVTIAWFALAASLWQALGLFRLVRGDHDRDAQVRPEARWGELAGRGRPLIEIDVNRAEVGEMALLPGVGPILARRIIQYRRQHGPFESVEALGRVDGIGSRTLQGIRELAYVELIPLDSEPTDRHVQNPDSQPVFPDG